MNDSESRPNPAAPGSSSIEAVLVPVALFALAAVLWSHQWQFTSPVAPATEVPRWATDIATIRQPSLRPETEIGGYAYRCGTCHKMFASRVTTGHTVTQHREIVLKHGINDRCLNCHHPTNRDVFADDTGGEIPYDQPQILCAKCHGPVYRDWSHGVHGRTNGHWNPDYGPMERKTCTECHDPHVPPFPPMWPAPAPDTLRMGNQQRHLGLHEGPESPLLIHRRAIDAEQPGEKEHE